MELNLTPCMWASKKLEELGFYDIASKISDEHAKPKSKEWERELKNLDKKFHNTSLSEKLEILENVLSKYGCNDYCASAMRWYKNLYLDEKIQLLYWDEEKTREICRRQILPMGKSTIWFVKFNSVDDFLKLCSADENQRLHTWGIDITAGELRKSLKNSVVVFHDVVVCKVSIMCGCCGWL